MIELHLIREVHGFRRTACGCEWCKVYCRHMPGTLDPSDLARLCQSGQDLFVWAEQHLRALVDQPYPALVPARNEMGHCHWYYAGKCAVHESAPYSCAFFDAHMEQEEVNRRVEATIRACKEDATADGLYYRLWLHLCDKKLVANRGDQHALLAEVQRLSRRAQRHRQRQLS